MSKAAKSFKPPRLKEPDQLVAQTIDTWLAVVHVVGKRFFGPLWMTLFESVQDAIALGLLVQVPSLLSKFVLGQEFAGLDACWINGNVWSISRYACAAIVLSDYTLWAVLIPRILVRCFRDLKKLLGESEK